MQREKARKRETDRLREDTGLGREKERKTYGLRHTGRVLIKLGGETRFSGDSFKCLLTISRVLTLISCLIIHKNFN